MTTTTSLRTILEDTASAITGDPGLAAVRFAADCQLVGVTEVDVRLHNRVVKADQPPILGGNDVGPKPVEIALAALGSCQAMTYRFWSEKLSIHIDKLTVDVQGDLDLHGIFGLRDGVRPGFGNVNVNVHITGPETPERYEELRQAVNNHCPVLDVFTNPVPVTTSMSREPTVSTTRVDRELKARHRTMWASGDYPSMVETFLLPLGPTLVEACNVGPGLRVLDVAAGTGNASIPAAQRGATVVASDLTPELLDAGRRRAEAIDVELQWVEADAERLPFGDGNFDVVMSCIGAMFAPNHQDVADELVRVCRRGGTLGLASWTPEGMIGGLFRVMRPFAPPPPPGASPPPLWGSEEHLHELFGDRVKFTTLERRVLEVTAFPRAIGWGEHFTQRYGPTITARANARREGREREFDDALAAFCEEWNLGTDNEARFEQEYLLAVAQRV
jgi:SAM-dependent methyltransferase/uncharacterized OsmC-like protein